MPTYKLTYFNVKARAELARYIFAYAGAQYEDIRLDGEAWAKLKPSTPFGSLPMLEVDGVVISQSMTIARYLAKTFGLAGKTDLDQAKIDMVADCISDVIQPLPTMFYIQDEDKKEEFRKKLSEELFPKNLEKLEKLLVSNNGGDGFFVGNQVTWADLYFAVMSEWPMAFAKVDMDYSKYPKLQALIKRVESLPKIAEWIAKRPVTER